MAHSPAPPEDDFERHLRGETSLSRLLRELPKEEPPTRMADAVRAAARQSVQQRQAARSKQPGWFDRLFQQIRLPLVSVLTGVLVVGVSLRVLLEKGDEGLLDPGFDQPVATKLPAEDTAAPATQSTQPTRPAAAPSKPARPAPTTPQKATGMDLEEKSLPFDLSNLGNVPPDQWLEDIRVLVKQGKAADAKEELVAFLKAHPEHALPDDIKALTTEYGLAPIATSSSPRNP
jgi:hypothetical protein